MDAKLKEFAEVLQKAESTVGNVGEWKGEYSPKAGYSPIAIWIGDKSGSRRNQYEGLVSLGVHTEVRAKTYSALIKKIITVLKENSLLY